MNVSHSCCPLINLCVRNQELIEKTGNIITFNIKALEEPGNAIDKRESCKTLKNENLKIRLGMHSTN